MGVILIEHLCLSHLNLNLQSLVIMQPSEKAQEVCGGAPAICCSALCAGSELHPLPCCPGPFADSLQICKPSGASNLSPQENKTFLWITHKHSM